jgi:hypothetical protein
LRTSVVPERDSRAVTPAGSVSVLVTRRTRRPVFRRRKRAEATAAPTLLAALLPAPVPVPEAVPVPVPVPGVGRARRRRVEEQLRGELVGLARAVEQAGLEVDVDRAALIPAGVDRRERRLAVGVGDLHAAQVPLARRAFADDVGVRAGSIRVPDVDGGARDRRAVAVGAHDDHREADRRAGLDASVTRIGADVRAIEHLVDEVRALGLVGRQHARRGRGLRDVGHAERLEQSIGAGDPAQEQRGARGAGHADGVAARHAARGLMAHRSVLPGDVGW